VFSRVAIGLAALLAIFLALPVVALATRVAPGEIVARLADPAVREALLLSLKTTALSCTIIVALGLPTAYVLATRAFPGKGWIESLLELPMVLPPTVAGFALLVAFGRMGLVGHQLAALGITVPFTTAAVVVAQTFMAAPYFVSPARAGFESVDRRLLDAAATLRAGEGVRFARVLVPLSLPSLGAGLALAAARSLGEFGATITFAGNLGGVTRTMPLAVYVALQSDLDTALVLALLLLVASLALLAGLRLLRKGPRTGLALDARPRRPA
jgi:molybdate transport system permease protein